MSILKISGLTKSYKKKIAIEDINIEVAEGAVFGLVGLNGAGKTTTIKSVTGLLKKFDGDIELAGVPWGHADYNKNYAFLPELFTPPPYLTGMEYIRFMQELHGVPLNEERVLELADEMNFDRDYLSKKTKTYSKGTMQKLGLIQTVCSELKMMILDEPMSGLDPLARARFKNVIKSAHDTGRTVFLSTHILHDIDIMCTHLGIMHKGHIIFNGTPAELKAKHGVEDLEKAFLQEIAL